MAPQDSAAPRKGLSYWCWFPLADVITEHAFKVLRVTGRHERLYVGQWESGPLEGREATLTRESFIRLKG